MAAGPRVVVGAAIIDGRPPAARVLAAQRSEPPDLAGLWEFPGGKVEPGESEVDALVRECREELGLDLAVGARIGPDTPIVGGAFLLRVWTARATAGRLRLLEHRAVRWLVADEMHAVPWIPADLPVVGEVARLLRGPR